MNTEQNLFQGENFNRIKIPEKIIKDKEFFNCAFVSCNFFEHKFENCEFEKCSFESCDLSLASFKNSRLLDTIFKNSKIIGVNWSLCKSPANYDFYNCKLDNGSFMGQSLTGMKIINCSAKEVDFTETDLSKAELQKTDFLKSRFFNTNLSYADFSEALNYSINPTMNKLKKTIFTLPEAINLLDSFNVVIK